MRSILGFAVILLTVGVRPAPAFDDTPTLRGHQARPDRPGWGVAIEGAGLANVQQDLPVQIELIDERGTLSSASGGYDTFGREGGTHTGRATVVGPGDSRFEVEDRWRDNGAVIALERKVTVVGRAPGGFASGIVLEFPQASTWSEAEWFAPGMLYGGPEHLSPHAIGGSAWYRPGAFTVRIREDRLPAPLLLAHFGDGHSLALLDVAPRGTTTAADSLQTRPAPLTDARFAFGALGGEEHNGVLTLGYWMPGGEGEVTYTGDTYPGGQLHQWRKRFHPIEAGLVHEYRLAIRLGRQESFPAAMAAAWRWAWQRLEPPVVTVDLDAARRSLVDVLARNVVENPARAGIPNYIDAVSKQGPPQAGTAVLGFTGKNLEAAECLIRESWLDASERGEALRRQGEAIIGSFLKIALAPPQAEGFLIESGAPALALPETRQVYLRSFGDDLKALLRLHQFEKAHGRDHPEWLAWCITFGDWLLTQQQPAGGFPRSWRPGTGAVAAASPNASFNAVPLLVLLAEATQRPVYLEAARRAGEFCWSNAQCRGQFVGGTIDNPDVLDKEAATLSLEAYLALHRATGDAHWLNRARAAADHAETWIYLWNVPMPDDDDDASRHWKRGVPTTGLQLISTGHSLVDAYMAFDADEFARLAQLTGDSHYRDVARLLLHNTKAMLALPGRTYDLGQPGWQQEHWSLAPRRGYGLHRGWLPWVATSQLNGIFGLMEVEPALLNEPKPFEPDRR